MEETREPPKVDEDEDQRADTPSDYSNTSSSSYINSRPTSREHTPGPMPKFRYDKVYVCSATSAEGNAAEGNGILLNT